MRNIALKSALAALIVSAPLAGAYAAGPQTRPAPEDIVYSNSVATSVDAVTTGSIRTAPAASDLVKGSPADRTYRASVEGLQRNAANVSLDQLLASQIRAAEVNVSNARQNGYVDEGRVAQIRASLASIREQARAGVSEGSYQALTGQIQSVNQDIHTLING